MRFRLAAITMATLVLAALAGCEKKQSSSPADGKSQQAAPPAASPLVPNTQVIDWCREHGVPESVCTQCNPSLVASFQAKGGWCEEHKVPESQCFGCHPELMGKFAAAFKQKYGKEPPGPPQEND